MTAHEHHDTDPPSDAPIFWEERYQGLDEGWGRNPNAVLVDVLGEVTPGSGRVLELGAGHGGDSLWLASSGWTVTAVDISATALRRVDEAAAGAGLTARVSTQRHDLTETFPEGTFEMVTATYFQSPVDFDRAAVLRRAAESIVSGGWLMLIDHGSTPSWSEHGDHHFPTVVETLAEIGLDEQVWRAEICTGRERDVTGPGGEVGVITDLVLALHKRG